MLFISTSTPMVCSFILAICIAVFSFILKSSVFLPCGCVFPFGVHIFALKEDNSKSIPHYILHNDFGQNLCVLQLIFAFQTSCSKLNTQSEPILKAFQN